MIDPSIDTLDEEATRIKRLKVTFTQLENFEQNALELEATPRPADIDPVIRRAQVEASRSVARDLRAEATMLAGGRYVCTKAEPWSETKGARACHPAAVDDGGCSDGCCDYYRCPYCGTRWRVEHDG